MSQSEMTIEAQQSSETMTTSKELEIEQQQMDEILTIQEGRMAKRIILLIVKSTNFTVANDPVPTFALELQGWYILDGRMKSQQDLDSNTVIDFSAFSS